MSNEATFVPIGVKAEDAPHVVVVSWQTGEAKALPVAGWFITEKGPEPGLFGPYRVWHLDPLEDWVVDGYGVWEWKLCSSEAEARGQVSRWEVEAHKTRVAFLAAWHERIGEAPVAEDDLTQQFKQHKLPLPIELDSRWDPKSRRWEEVNEERRFEILANWDNDSFDHKFRLEYLCTEDEDGNQTDCKFRVVSTQA